MKHILLSTTVLATALGINAQIIHMDLDPDKVLQMPLESYNSMSLDVDGDQKDDFKFQYFNYPSFNIWNLGIVQADTNMVKVETLINDAIAPSQIGDYYVKVLSENDNISSSAPFSDDYPQIGDIYYANFLGETGKYLGFRLKSGSDYKYGWMAIELTGTGDLTYTIKEYAYQSKVNTAIKAGQSGGVGIEYVKLETAGFALAPNPATNYVRLTHSGGKNISEVKVFSLQGSLVKQWTNPALPMEIETTSWNKGTYIVEISEAGATYQQLLIRN